MIKIGKFIHLKLWCDQGPPIYIFLFILTAPNCCQKCKSGHKFEPLQSSAFTNTTDWQIAKIQEIQSQVRKVFVHLFYYVATWCRYIKNVVLSIKTVLRKLLYSTSNKEQSYLFELYSIKI